MKKVLFKLTGLAFILVVLVEVLDRLVLGLGEPPVYIEDPDYKYI